MYSTFEDIIEKTVASNPRHKLKHSVIINANPINQIHKDIHFISVTSIIVLDIKMFNRINWKIHEHKAYNIVIYFDHNENHQSDLVIQNLNYTLNKLPNFNCACILSTMSFVDFFTEFQNVMHYIHHYQESSAKLLEAFLSNKGMQPIIDIAAEILENPIDLIDPMLKLIAKSSKTTVDDPFWLELDQKGYISNHSFEKMRLARVIEKVNKSNPNHPVLLDNEYFSIPRYIISVVVEGIILGKLSVFAANRPFTYFDQSLLILIAKILGEQIKKEQTLQMNSGMMEDHLFLALLNNTVKNQKLVYERLSLFNLTNSRQIYVFTVSIDQSEKYNIIFQYLQNECYKLFPLSKIVIYEDITVIIVNRDKHQKLTDTKLDAFKSFLNKHKLFAGLSYGFQDIMQLRHYYIQAIEAMRIGQKIAMNGPLYKYEEAQLYHMVALATENTPIETLCHPDIIKLQKYDAEHNTALLHTLSAYLKSGLVRDTAAKLLQIHANTLDYRLTKIRTLVDIDWKDGDVLQRIRFSLTALHFSHFQ